MLALGLTAGPAAPAPAQTPEAPAPYDGTLTLEVWAIDDRIIHDDQLPEERMLREAQYTLSGMIYGWDFTYTPAYPAREVERVFQLTPIGSIRWGDPRLALRDFQDLRRRDNALYGQMDFVLSDTDRARLASWDRLETARGGGIATMPLQQGLPGKLAAIEEAVAQAIRDHLRSRTFNRPREVVGSVLLERPPRIRTVSGAYEAEVRIFIRIDEVLEYLVF